MSMDTIKQLLAKYATPFLVKIVLRGLAYGTAFVSAKLAIESPDADALTKTAEWGGAALAAGLGLLIDYLQHRWQDKQPAKA
jgi:hypothetical protein